MGPEFMLSPLPPSTPLFPLLHWRSHTPPMGSLTRSLGVMPPASPTDSVLPYPTPSEPYHLNLSQIHPFWPLLLHLKDCTSFLAGCSLHSRFLPLPLHTAATLTGLKMQTRTHHSQLSERHRPLEPLTVVCKAPCGLVRAQLSSSTDLPPVPPTGYSPPTPTPRLGRAVLLSRKSSLLPK